MNRGPATARSSWPGCSGWPSRPPEQAAVIGAPPRPLAVIAGAGSGKSETMAARLVWLVANGLVRPERVLGLTFTRKAAAELGQRVRARLDGLRARRTGPSRRSSGGRQLPGWTASRWSSTYHAYAGPAGRRPRAARGAGADAAADHPGGGLADRGPGGGRLRRPDGRGDLGPATVTAAVLDLAGELAEHLRDARTT